MRTRAFSLIEVLISIVVLALGLLGIAAVFPAVVSQQRATTDSVQGESLRESVRQYIASHRLLNRASTKTEPDGTVLRVNLRGWQLLTDNYNWSTPVAPNSGLFDGNFAIPGNDVTQAGLNTDPGSGITWILNGDATQPSAPIPDTALLNEPLAWVHVTERQLPVWPTGAPSSYARPDAQYVWDFAARRIGSGFPYRPGLSPTDRTLSLQDDALQVAVFIRRKDRPPPSSTTGVPVSEDTNGRPTFDGRGQYSLIREATYTLVGFASGTGTGPTNVLDFDGLTNARYLAQVGQKIVDQWGEVHEVIKADLVADNHVVITIRETTQRPGEGVKVGNAKAYMEASPTVDLKMIFTNQIPAAVSVFDVRPASIPRT